METIDRQITICQLECVLMENGEIISAGKTIGWFKDMKKYLTPLRDGITGEAITK